MVLDPCSLSLASAVISPVRGHILNGADGKELDADGVKDIDVSSHLSWIKVEAKEEEEEEEVVISSARDTSNSCSGGAVVHESRRKSSTPRKCVAARDVTNVKEDCCDRIIEEPELSDIEDCYGLDLSHGAADDENERSLDRLNASRLSLGLFETSRDIQLSEQEDLYSKSFTQGLLPKLSQEFLISSQESLIERTGRVSPSTRLEDAKSLLTSNGSVTVPSAALLRTRTQGKFVKLHRDAKLADDGSLQFSCPHCSKTFHRSSNFSRHMRIHRGVYSYVCGTCSRGFFRREHYAKHKCDRRGSLAVSTVDMGMVSEKFRAAVPG